MNSKVWSVVFVAVLFGVVSFTGRYLPNSPNLITSSTESTMRPIETPVNVVDPVSTKAVKVTGVDWNKGTVVFFTTEVTTETADNAIRQIREANTKKPGKPIYLMLDSPGGSVIDGGRIISAMQASPAPVYTVCLQICASMAAMIMEYGTERYAVDRAFLMFHPASLGGMFSGEVDKIVSRLSFLKRYVDKMDYHTAERAGIPYAEFKAKTMRELWIDAEDSLRDHLIDKIVRVDIQMPTTLNFGNNKVRENVNLSWE